MAEIFDEDFSLIILFHLENQSTLSKLDSEKNTYFIQRSLLQAFPFKVTLLFFSSLFFSFCQISKLTFMIYHALLIRGGCHLSPWDTRIEGKRIIKENIKNILLVPSFWSIIGGKWIDSFLLFISPFLILSNLTRIRGNNICFNEFY